MPTRLLLFYDTPGWACEGECISLVEHLDRVAPGEFETQVLQCGTARSNLLLQSDLVFSTIYYHLREAAHPKSISQISSYSYWIRKDWPGGWPHLKNWKHIVAKNSDIYNKLTADDHQNIRQLYHPLNPKKWRPLPSPPNDVFTVGYAGHEQALKGLDLIKEAVMGMDSVRLVTATWESNRLASEQMPRFYAGLDAYICMSRAGEDAGPNPPIEAGLCGVPVITTASGQIGEMVTHRETGYIVERDVVALREAIAELRSDSKLKEHLAEEARQHFYNEWCLRIGEEWVNYFREIRDDG